MSILKSRVADTPSGLVAQRRELEEMEREIQRRRQEIEAAEEALDRTTPVHRLAIVLHDKFCRWNHTDGCGFFYEVNKGVHSWSSREHQNWLAKADALMQRVRREPVTDSNVEEFFTNLGM